MKNEDIASMLVTEVCGKRIDFIPAARQDAYECAMRMADIKDKEVSFLTGQIESLKMCGNCAHCVMRHDEEDRWEECEVTGMGVELTDTCGLWELLKKKRI